MEEKINRISSFIQRAYCIFWLIPLLLVMAGEVGGDWTGFYAEDVRLTYLSETLVILLTAIMVPVSLKLFSWVLETKIDKADLSRALQLYALWSCIRLFMLALPVMAGLAVYYAMLSNKGALCALIGLTASLFCIPGKKRLRRELQLGNTGNE